MFTTDPALTAGSMVEVLQARADLSPDLLAFCFLIDGEEEGPRLSYAQLDRAARALAATLQDVAAPGDRALLLYAPGLDFIVAFFGCQYAGLVPGPAYPPRLDRLAQGLQTLGSIAADCQPRVILTGGPVAPFIAGSVKTVPAMSTASCIVTDGVDPAHARRWREPMLDGDALALIQYTSGSTALPKGVMVTHRNLMHNERLIQAALEHSGPGLGVDWLPPYHDLGLIGGLLQVVFHGASSMLMSPLAMLQKPSRWLQAISRYRADTSGGPSFAYELCVQRISPEERSSLDLRNWSVAAIGSEHINPRAIEEFTATFEPCGFRPETFYPGYGLAEATLLVTGGAKSDLPVIRDFSSTTLEQGRAAPAKGEDSRRLVGCGHPWLGNQVRIVDPDTEVSCSDGAVGEIWVAGPSVAKGYWNRPEETKHAFAAQLRDDRVSPDVHFLRTGDLGFLQDGELFVTGRIKDVIVIRGRNYYPEDIERTVQAVHPGLRPGCGAAVEISRDGHASLVFVQEIDRRSRQLDVAALIGDIRQAVAERHELQVQDVQFLEYGSIPKTSSGKVQRHRCRAGYEQGTLRLWREKRT